MAVLPLIVLSFTLATCVRCQDIVVPEPPRLPSFFPGPPPDVMKVLNVMRKTAEDVMQRFQIPEVGKKMLSSVHGRNSSLGQIREIAFESNRSPGDEDTHISLQIQVIPLQVANGTKLNGTKDPRAESLRRVLRILEGKERPKVVNETKVANKEGPSLSPTAVEIEGKNVDAAEPSKKELDSPGRPETSSKALSTEKSSKVIGHRREPRNASQALQARASVGSDIVSKCYNTLFRHGLLLFVMVVMCAFACFLGSLLPTIWERRSRPSPIIASHITKDRWISPKALCDPRIFRPKVFIPPSRAAAGDAY